MPRYTDEDGVFAVKTARETINKYLKERKVLEVEEVPPKFKEKAGVFVTLESYPSMELRGCIGYPEPIFPLIDALRNAAISAATEDPRFFPIGPKEFEETVVEVSLLTPPELINVKKP
ncbi:MAG: TIGR00296 family protein, partial [Thermoplasmata archaeon]